MSYRRLLRSSVLDNYRRMNNQQQEQPNNMERCLIALTQILANQNQPQNLRSRIGKELKYMPTFNGEPGTLPSFIETVERTLATYQAEAAAVYTIIYNEKIGGAAKNYLAAEIPTTWEQCKEKLKIHYRPTRDQTTIIREISTLKVNTISELLDRVQEIINYITEYAAFSENQVEIITSLSCMLVLRIKELAAGALAAELYNKYDLSSIRPILYKYVGQDRYNLMADRFHNVTKSHSKPQNNFSGYNNRFNNYNQNRYNNNFRNNTQFRNSNQFRNQFQNNNQFRNNNQFQMNNFGNNNQYRNNSSNQFRNNNNNGNNSGQSRPLPMEVDNLTEKEDVNQIVNNEFFIN